MKLQSTLLVALLLTGCASAIKSPVALKSEDQDYINNAAKVYNSNEELVREQKANCLSTKSWSWDKIPLNQNAFVVKHNRTKTYASVMCVSTFRPQEQILKFVNVYTNLSTADEKQNNIYKNGYVPFFVSAYDESGKAMDIKPLRTSTEEGMRLTFVEFNETPKSPVFLVLNVNQTYDPAVGQRSAGRDFTLYPLSSGVVKANWTDDSSQSYRRSNTNGVMTARAVATTPAPTDHKKELR
ncbi:MAG: hypothetical protein JST80_06690 [Bdellovibrionales bacterium]|nr:hypothetical protein [Bdellovibrionales bacterium]